MVTACSSFRGACAEAGVPVAARARESAAASFVMATLIAGSPGGVEQVPGASRPGGRGLDYPRLRNQGGLHRDQCGHTFDHPHAVAAAEAWGPVQHPFSLHIVQELADLLGGPATAAD